MANPIFASQQLTQQNYKTEIAKALQSIREHHLAHDGIAFGNADAVHRLHVFVLHSTKRNGFWW